MRHLDMATGVRYSAPSGMETLTDTLKNLEKTARWPGPSMEEWRRSAFPKEDELPRAAGTPLISWEIAEEDQDAVVIGYGIDDEALALFRTDLADSQTLLDYRHRLDILSRPGSTAVSIRIRKGKVLSRPVVLRYSYRGRDTRYNAHTFILCEQEADARVVEIHDGRAPEMFVTAGTHASCGPGSRLSHELIQNLDDSAVFAYQSLAQTGRDASYRSFEGQFGSRIAKSRMTAECLDKGGDVHMNGVYTARGNQKKDLKPVQRHSSPRCASRSYYKGAVQEDGATVFQGIIEVAKGAFETDAYLSNKNLILNDGARADSIPNLEILNNNVKCSHGSTTGTLREDELFYLESRGIGRKEGRAMLIEAYIEDALGNEQGREPHPAVYEALAQFLKNGESEKP
ncbi:MAG: SufD family Fe-S cluster assembly protein [Spirochaetales bacterium]|nr:SufD family Fe-S cluster assembly protein [Spirochaetales bacterium]